MKLLKELSQPTKSSFNIPEPLDIKTNIPADFLRTEIDLPELSEVEVVRHYTNLSKMNFGVDNGFYPLGSCTMKYNPKICEDIAKMSQFNVHPLSPNNQAVLQIMYEIQQMLSTITGMANFSPQPAAGAHGELTALMMIKAYFAKQKENRNIILIPDAAHGTNPASAAFCGFETVVIKSTSQGSLDLTDLKSKLSNNVAALMLTHPNTLGIFDENVVEINNLVHQFGAFSYMDGANLNALLGIVKPQEIGFDIMHINLHKTFATPHGGGGPGSGPVGAIEKLIPFLPSPQITKNGDEYELNYSAPDSIGKVHAFYGNFNVVLKAYIYIKAIGAKGLKQVSENALLNANYMKEKLKIHFNLPYDRICQHEFVLNDENLPNNVTTNDLAKRLIDYSIHPPTVYFPLIVHGAIMIEPTETESLESMDNFIDAMLKIKEEAKTNPDLVKTSPHSTPVKKLNGVKAARNPILNWKASEQ